MKSLTPDLAAHLQTGATTLATCWILKRTDGFTLGFTDHDEPLTLEEVTCEPATGMTGSEMRQSHGFASDDQDISGILSSSAISETDLISGRYDGATIETWRLNWQSPEQKLHLRTGYLGEVKRTETSFQAEIRGLSVAMEQEQGRIYQYGCDATCGDLRCGLDLTRPDLHFDGTIIATSSQTNLTVNFTNRPSAGRLDLGQMTLLSGEAEGMVFDIMSHNHAEEHDQLELWLPLHGDVAPGDQVLVQVGCDKSFATCRDIYANQQNFRGFPHIPGNDFVLSAPDQHQVRDGSTLMKE
ncbi:MULTISPECIES: DUF2163 domain-containing protein [Cohaesibacter]|uniref:DUF2163 domain-containing protein n=1 Tax=Cohaesibacter TaxID=655352 RepID=UPI000DE9D2D3|nr:MULTISPECIES: DUF2163 domain-containing protein [Cohaesibacter]TLP44818.1 DUF2163 domain-containing protein [Cohaesibacter sp. CAU 1516]